MSGKQLFYLFIIIVVGSCKTGSTVKGSKKANSSFSSKDIIQIHQKASPDFGTLASRIHVSYEDEKKSQSVTVSLRMEKDKKIWIKASLIGITLAKVLITPESVSYYETVSNTYFEGNFELLSKWLGTEIDFQKAQSILLGQSIFDLKTTSYSSKVIQNKYNLQPKRQPQNFIHSLLLYPENFKVAKGTLSQPNDDRLLTIDYEEYQALEGSYYPSDILIKAVEKGKTTTYELKYRKIDLNVSVNFPFTIPSGYKEIELD